MSYQHDQYLTALPEQPEALIMIALMRARSFSGFRYIWTEGMSQPAAVRAAPGCIQVKPCIISPRELLMLTYWKDQDSLMAFFRSQAHVGWMRYLAAHPNDLNMAAEIYSPQRPGLYLHEPQGMALVYPRAEGVNQGLPHARP